MRVVMHVMFFPSALFTHRIALRILPATVHLHLQHAHGTAIDWSIGACVFTAAAQMPNAPGPSDIGSFDASAAQSATQRTGQHGTGAMSLASVSGTDETDASSSSSSDHDTDKCTEENDCDRGASSVIAAASSSSAVSSWAAWVRAAFAPWAGAVAAVVALILHLVQRNRLYRSACTGTPACPLLDCRLVVLPSKHTASVTPSTASSSSSSAHAGDSALLPGAASGASLMSTSSVTATLAGSNGGSSNGHFVTLQVGGSIARRDSKMVLSTM